MSKLNEDSQLGFYYGGKLFPIDIEKEGYNLSSELFHFKELRRGIIEHGKMCYIEGYKKHSELFCTFLVKNGYFSDEELNKISAEFEAQLTGKPELSIRYAEDTITQLYPRISYLTQIQKDIVEKYNELTNEQNTLLIQKPRQKGVSTICKTIAYIESMNNKKVLYIGYEPELYFRKINNLTFRNANNIPSADSFVGKKFDLVIVDEIITFTLPIKMEHDLMTTLTENGRMIIVGTPLEPDWRNYNEMKDFFKPCNTQTDNCTSKLTYTIFPNSEDYNRAEKYPQHKNEMLGQWTN